MTRTVLILNAGSSSVKLQLFAGVSAGGASPALRGLLEGVGARPRLRISDAGGRVLEDSRPQSGTVADVAAAVDRVVSWLEAWLGGSAPDAVGHRVVHGGPDFAEPVRVDRAVLERLRSYVPLAPLHQPANLAAIEAVAGRWPAVPQIACFDTAFHRHHPEVADIFAVPWWLHAAGVRRYGFHGVSYEYVALRLREVDPGLARGRVVVAHLGSGCSMCALDAGRSVACTMSFTPLDGLPMATRPGSIDPGVLLWLMRERGFDAARLQRFLYHECGLAALSEVGRDLRDILAAGTARARLALDYFVHRIRAETGSLAAQMGGLDGLVFTAGIGENAPWIRARVLEGLAWLGFELDPAANDVNAATITRPGSPKRALVLPTDEEAVILRHVLARLGEDAEDGTERRDETLS